MIPILALTLALAGPTSPAATFGDDARALTKQIASADVEKAEAAVAGLKRLGRDGVDGLLAGTKHGDARVRAAAWLALAGLKGQAAAALAPACAFLATPPRDEWASPSECAFGIAMQVGFLAKSGSADIAPKNATKEQRADAQRLAERLAATCAASAIGAADPAAFGAIVARADVPLDRGYLDLHAAWMLAVHELDAAREALLRDGLAGGDPGLQAACLLAAVGGEEKSAPHAARIAELLDAPNAGVRGLAWEALLAIDPSNEAARAKADAALADESAFVRVLAARALTRHGGRGELAQPVLLACFHDASPFVRAAAVQAYDVELVDEMRALGKKGPDDAFRPKSLVAPMTKLLGDREPNVRKRAASVLQRFGADAKMALPALKKASKDPSEDVRKAAERALRAIEG